MNLPIQELEQRLHFSQNMIPEHAAIVEAHAQEQGWQFTIEPAVHKLLHVDNELIFKVYYTDPAFGEGLDQKIYRVIQNAYNPPKKLARAHHVGNDFYIVFEIAGVYAAIDHFFSDEDRSEGLERPEDGEVVVDAFPALIHLYIGERDCVFVSDVPLDDISQFLKA